MKKLFFALICTAIGFSASANDSNPKKSSSIKADTEVTVTLDGYKSSKKLAKSNNNAFRIQRSFRFTDFCGKTYILTVTSPNGTSYNDMGAAAINAWTSNFDNFGCFHAENL